MLVSYVFAVAAAAVNATSNVLQRKANSTEPPQLSMRLGLIVDLVRRPVWLAGFGAVLVSFILTAVALSRGRLASVQPVLVLELPLTLLLASRVFGTRLHWREWGASLAMVIGLGGLLVALSPQAGTGGHAPALQWGLASAGTIGLAATCVAFAVTGTGARRAALLGVAGGVLFGLTAAYMKGMTGTLTHGIGNVFTSWQVYAMAVAGACALFLTQNALQAGRLLVAQPGITLCDPAVGMLWGTLVFHESTRGGLALLAAVACGCVLVGGVVAMMHSPLLTEALADQQHGAVPPASGTGTADSSCAPAGEPGVRRPARAPRPADAAPRTGP